MFLGLLISIGIISTITAKLANPVKNVVAEQYTAGFGSITPPKIKDAAQVDQFKPKSISLDTLNGSYPDFNNKFGISKDSPGLINLYKIDYPEIQGESRQNGLVTADALGFIGKPTITDKDLHYQWTDGKRNLLYNVDTRTFEMFTLNLTTLDTSLPEYGNLSSAQNFVQSLFSDINATTNEKLSYYKTDYVKYDYNTTSWAITNANDQSPSNFIRVSFMRYSRTKGKDPLPDTLDLTNPDPTIVKEYYPGYDYSPVYVVIRNSKELKPSDIIEISYYKYDYDITRPQTYPLKNIDDAFKELQSTKADLVKVTNENNEPISNDVLSKLTPDVKVKNIYAGYYLSDAKTAYVLPVYVFDCDFVISTEGINQKKGHAVYYVYAFKNP